MRTESDLLLWLVYELADNGIDAERTPMMIHSFTGLTVNNKESVKINMTKKATQILLDLYYACIGELTMGYRVTQKDAEDTIEEISDYLIVG